MKKLFTGIIVTLILSLGLAVSVSAKGLVAIKCGDGVFLSWEKTAEKYDIFKNGEKIAERAVTNYTDPTGTLTDTYTVDGETVSVWEKNYLEIPITAPETTYKLSEDNLKKAAITPPIAGESNWHIYYLESGEVVLVNDEGSVVDVNAQGTTAGTKVGTYAYNGGDNQKFTLEESNGKYKIKGKQSGLYLSGTDSTTIENAENASEYAIVLSSASLTEKAETTAKALSGAVTYEANDAAVGDLDGDGQYEIVLKWNPSDAKDASQQGTTGNVYIDAYKTDGTRLWRIDMGKNIRAGAHDTQMAVYDLDSDGCAELALRTADGTVDGTGAVIGDASAVWTDNWSGKNLEGPLWLTIFEGKSGRAITSTPYDPQSNEPSISIFGDNYGNRSERYNMCVAYIAGKPNVVTQRGYYGGRASEGPGRTVIAAYSFDGTTLAKSWRFDTMTEGNEKYIGQGNHNISIGDADSDGNDEIFCGALTLDDDGSVLWCSFMGHGDAMHLGDFDPDREGLEFFAVHEGQTEAQKYGFTVFDAATGEILHAREAGKDTGRGLIANVGDFGGRYVAWAGAGAGKINSKGEDLDLSFNSMNFRIYWDGDFYDELLDGTTIFKVNSEGVQEVLFTADGCAANNGSKANPCLQADLFGDWREEVIWRTADNTALRIYTTTIPTEHSLNNLMTDHVYEMGVVWQNSSYNQPPHLGCYVTEGLTLRIGSETAEANGQKVTLDSPPVIIDDHTYVPVRFIAESFGCIVDYNDGIVTIDTPEGNTITIDSPFIINDRTMVPIRFISEELGKSVSWDDETKTVTVKRGDETLIAKKDVKIFIAGDSTAQSYRESMAPQAGWGQMLPLFFDESVTVENRAMAGRSLKSFFNEGRWQSILDDSSSGDYVIIQFGQNDGAWNKPERYISHEDFRVMLREEYIEPALARGLNVVLATQTQGHWFDGETGLIGEPGDGVSYMTLTREAAQEYNLPLLEINDLSRALENSLGEKESEKLHLYAEAGEYEKYPDGVADNTHFSFTGAFEIARLVAEGLAEQTPLGERLGNAYSVSAEFTDSADLDVRRFGLYDEFTLYIKSDGAVKVNGEAVSDKRCEATIRVKPVNGYIHIEGSGKAEVVPVFKFEPEGGIDTASEPYALTLPQGTYDFTFVKSDRERGDIAIDDLIVGANVDMYGTVGVPEGTRYIYRSFTTEKNPGITIAGKTTRLQAVEVSPSSTIFDKKTKVFVAGDSTLCNYYPVLPSMVESKILPGEVRTGWAQVLDRFLDDKYEVYNLASSGDWARDWRDRFFETIMSEGETGDYLIIQFGINDRNRDDKTHETMKAALTDMVTRCREKGIIPILVKPQPSVGYSWGSAGDFEKPNGNNAGFFNAVTEVAEETGCAYVDLNGLAAEHFAEVGREFVSKNYQLWNNETNEMADKLHISFAGAKKMAELFSENASEQGLLKTREYLEQTEVSGGLHVLKNSEETRYINISEETVTAENGNVTLYPYSEITTYEN